MVDVYQLRQRWKDRGVERGARIALDRSLVKAATKRSESPRSREPYDDTPELGSRLHARALVFRDS